MSHPIGQQTHCTPRNDTYSVQDIGEYDIHVIPRSLMIAPYPDVFLARLIALTMCLQHFCSLICATLIIIIELINYYSVSS